VLTGGLVLGSAKPSGGSGSDTDAKCLRATGDA